MTQRMNNLVDIVVEDSRWDAVDLSGLAEQAALSVLTRLGLPAEDTEVSLLACDDPRIADLNAQFRGKPAPTNVLSWPSVDLAAEADGGQPHWDEAEPELGDIALSWDTCLREADDTGIAFADHLMHLLIHGILHLLGYDHIRDKDAALMEAVEVAILGEMGIANPYDVSGNAQPNDGT